MKIRLKQGAGYKYYIVASLTSTVLTVVINTDYTVANSAITNVAYSFQDNPYGWPNEFKYTPTWTNLTVGNASVNQGAYSISGNVMVGRIAIQWGTTTSITGTGITASFGGGLVATAYGVTNHSIGIARMSIGGVPYQGTIVCSSGGTVASVTAIDASGTYAANTSVTSTVPATWSSTSNMELQFTVILAA